MQQDIMEQLCELEKAIGKTRTLADGFTARVENEKTRLDVITNKLMGLQGLLNQAGGVVGEIHIDLAVRP